MGRVLDLLRGRAGRCVSIEDNVPAFQSFSHPSRKATMRSRNKRQQMEVTQQPDVVPDEITLDSVVYYRIKGDRHP